MTTDDSTSEDPTPTDPTPTDPTPENVDEPEAELLPDDPSEGLGPDVPTAPDVASNDVPQELRKQFWTLVMLFNVALLGMSLGVMLVGFERRWTAGSAFFAVGALAFVRGWLGYRRVTSEGWSEDGDSGEADDEDGDSGEVDDANVRND